VSVFSKIVLGLPDESQFNTDTDWFYNSHLTLLYALPNDNWGVMSDTVYWIPVSLYFSTTILVLVYYSIVTCMHLVYYLSTSYYSIATCMHLVYFTGIWYTYDIRDG
jgi:hypothetical protein